MLRRLRGAPVITQLLRSRSISSIFFIRIAVPFFIHLICHALRLIAFSCSITTSLTDWISVSLSYFSLCALWSLQAEETRQFEQLPLIRLEWSAKLTIEKYSLHTCYIAVRWGLNLQHYTILAFMQGWEWRPKPCQLSSWNCIYVMLVNVSYTETQMGVSLTTGS